MSSADSDIPGPFLNDTLLYTYDTWPDWKTVRLPDGWRMGLGKETGKDVYIGPNGRPQYEHPRIFQTYQSLNEIDDPVNLFRLRPWQIKWDTIISTIPNYNTSKMPKDFKSQMIYKLIDLSVYSARIIKNTTMSLEKKTEELNRLRIKYHSEMVRFYNMWKDLLSLESRREFDARFPPAPTYKPKGGLRKTSKRRKTRKNRKTRRKH
jgi:hypothetical protein